MKPWIRFAASGILLSLTACSSMPPHSEPPPSREPASLTIYSNCVLESSSKTAVPQDFPVSMVKLSGKDEISLEIKSTPYVGRFSEANEHPLPSGRKMTRYARLTDPNKKEVASFWIEKIDNSEIILNEFGVDSLGRKNPRQLRIGQTNQAFLKTAYPKGRRESSNYIRCSRLQ